VVVAFEAAAHIGRAQYQPTGEVRRPYAGHDGGPDEYKAQMGCFMFGHSVSFLNKAIGRPSEKLPKSLNLRRLG